MPITFDQLMDLIQMLIIIIAMILLHRSIPSAQLARLFATLEKLAQNTDTPVDDAAVTVGKLFSQLLTGQATLPTATPAPVPAAAAVVVTSAPAATPAPVSADTPVIPG